MDVAIAAAGAILSAAVGFGLTGDPLGTLAGIPSAIAGVVLAWRGHRRATSLEGQLAEQNDRLRRLDRSTAFERSLDDEQRMARERSIRQTYDPHG